MNYENTNSKLIVILLFCLVVFILELLIPAEHSPLPKKKKAMRWFSNLGLWGMNGGLSILIILPISLFMTKHSIDWRPDVLKSWVIDLFILDGSIYTWHLLNHRVPFLWRFHRIHHLDQFLDVTSSVRFHFGEVFLSAIFRGVILIIFNIPFSMVVIFETIVIVCAMFHHSNIKIYAPLEKCLSYIIVTPSIHWMHHHTKTSDTHSNFSVLFSFWDRVFKTSCPNKRKKDMPIGLLSKNNKAITDRNILQLLLIPFKSKS